MQTGYFISNILKRYAAFIYEYNTKMYVNSSNTISRNFVWKYDTALPNRPIYSTIEDVLYDYSAYLNEKLTKYNYISFLKLDCNVKTWKVENLSVDDAEKIMKLNIETVLCLESRMNKAKKLKEIIDECL